MKVTCSNCPKIFDIPDERLPMGKEIAFPCPNCKAIIEIDLRSMPAENGVSDPNKIPGDRPTGEALKNKILRKVMDLPPMPQTVLKAREIMADPRSDFKQLAELFETDQAIALRIFKLANSPYYGLGGKVSSIQHATVVLGHKTLGEIITIGGISGLLEEDIFKITAMKYLSNKAHPDIQSYFSKILTGAGYRDLADQIFPKRPSEKKAILKVLAVDDSKMVLNIYRTVLHNLGYASQLFELPSVALE